ncbi:hypothetical protein V6N12_050838 [Hibiscus sabdariffa]|uniref:Uncharacterized protein n=1 Tax=Hibiscus sabdariffa TaxID=183260 RepID=A0ABR2GDR2_9ROSI
MGRAPCCDKANVKRGPWSPEEDAKLKAYIQQHGTGGNWISLPQKIGLKRCGKSCRLRWLNYLRPNIKHGGFSEEEDEIICSLYVTDNDIKNYWNTRLKKKLVGNNNKQNFNQDLKRSESGDSSTPFDNKNQNPYWPQLGIPLNGNISSQFVNSDCSNLDGANMLQGQTSFSLQRSDGMEFLYGDDIVNGTSSLVCPPFDSGMLQHFAPDQDHISML